MNKILISKRFITYLVIVLSILSFLFFLNYTNRNRYTITNTNQTVVVSFENGQYLALRPESDIITDPNTNTFRPFGGLNEFDFATEGFDFLTIRKNFIQTVASGDNIRIIKISPISPNTFYLRYEIITNLFYSDTSKYSIQLDYSKEAEFQIYEDHNTAIIKDERCMIEFLSNDNTNIEKLNDFPSLILSKAYSDGISFDLTVNINCSK